MHNRLTASERGSPRSVFFCVLQTLGNCALAMASPVGAGVAHLYMYCICIWTMECLRICIHSENYVHSIRNGRDRCRPSWCWVGSFHSLSDGGKAHARAHKAHAECMRTTINVLWLAVATRCSAAERLRKASARMLSYADVHMRAISFAKGTAATGAHAAGNMIMEIFIVKPRDIRSWVEWTVVHRRFVRSFGVRS